MKKKFIISAVDSENGKNSAPTSIGGKICFYHAIAMIDEALPEGNENESNAVREKRLVRYIRRTLFPGQRNITISLKVQCDTEFADFNFRVRFHFDGRSNDFAARVAKLVGEDFVGDMLWQEFDASDDNGHLYLNEEHFNDVEYFDIEDDGDRTRAMERLAKIAQAAPGDCPMDMI